MVNDIIFLGSTYGKQRQGYDGSVYSTDGVIPSILTNSITNNKMYILEEINDEERENRYTDPNR